MRDVSLNRRGWLSRVAAAAALPLVAPRSARADAPRPKRSLRIGHLTDAHVQPELGAGEGLAACLKHVMALPDRPELILSGGDAIMDAFGQDRDRTKLQWDLWHRVLKAECDLPVEAVIGNHDIWGWNRSASKATGAEPDYGKNWAVEALGIGRRYRSFDRSGWHFVALDNVQPGLKPGSYTAALDDEQFDWLARDLAAVPAGVPILVLSHIPILSAASFFDGAKVVADTWVVPGAIMHTDLARIKDLFAKHPGVKLCLSGHLHLVERVDYNGVTYLCDGAVCGNWWKGNYQECAPGYAVLDLYPDGSFERQYLTYGWQPRA